MACPPSIRIQQMLQGAVQSVQWTYSLFWQFCPRQGVLVWGDGYYNGAIKTRKTVQVQPMEVSAEEASLQRSQQLKELYESLSAGETNQPARRPCAALSPEDLTESEWFYLMCVSFSFPPGVGLPGKSYARQHHVWLTGANEVDSKVFSRAILAKSVVCIPLMDGVVELGTIERVEEDLALVQHVKSFFMDHYTQCHPKPTLSEHSTSNPTSSIDQPIFHSPSLATVFTVADSQIREVEANQEVVVEEEEEEEEADSDAEAETGRGTNVVPNPLQITGQNQMGIGTAEPNELMQLEMSEDIMVGSPDDCSNNLDSKLQLDPTSHCVGEIQQQRHVDSYRVHRGRAWPLLQDELRTGLPPSEHPSAFTKWSCKSDHLIRLPLEGTSQWLLKYILFSVPFLHSKYRDDNNSSPQKSPQDYGNCSASRFRKGTQDELSANHVLAERRRREKLNERFIILRSLVPFVTKMDKASILGDTIEYVKQLRRRIQDLELRNRQIGPNQKTKAMKMHEPNGLKEQPIQSNNGYTKSSLTQSQGDDRSRLPTPEKRKMRIVEESGGVKTKLVETAISNMVQVSIIESDALLELQCPYRDGLLLEIMQLLCELCLEVTAVQSSLTNGVFVAELRAKVRDRINGKKASIVEVKRAINQIIPQC